MKRKQELIFLPILVIFLTLSWQCAENTIDADLSHTGLNLDTLTIRDINGYSYQTPPEIGTLKYLYFGQDSTYKIDYNLFTIKDRATNGLYWHTFLDSNIQVDSLTLVLSSNDSVAEESFISDLRFSHEFTFDEYIDNYTSIDTSLQEWISLGQPTAYVMTDTNDYYEQTDYRLNIASLLDVLSDTTDTNSVISFLAKTNINLSDFFRVFSRHYSSGVFGPRVIANYTKRTTTDDTTTIDTLELTFLTEMDLSILSSLDEVDSTSYNNWFVGSGGGYKSVISFNFDSLALPERSLIRAAHLYLYASDNITTGYNINTFAINLDTTITGQWFLTDPYTGNASFVSSASFSNNVFSFSIKNFLQNVTLGNVSNFGIILKANDSNDPFITAEILSSSEESDMRLEILYENP